MVKLNYLKKALKNILKKIKKLDISFTIFIGLCIALVVYLFNQNKKIDNFDTISMNDPLPDTEYINNTSIDKVANNKSLPDTEFINNTSIDKVANNKPLPDTEYINNKSIDKVAINNPLLEEDPINNPLLEKELDLVGEGKCAHFSNKSPQGFIPHYITVDKDLGINQCSYLCKKDIMA